MFSDIIRPEVVPLGESECDMDSNRLSDEWIAVPELSGSGSGTGGTAPRLDWRSGELLRRVRSVSTPAGAVYDASMEASNKYLLSVGQDKRLQIWNVSTGKLVRSYKPEVCVR